MAHLVNRALLVAAALVISSASVTAQDKVDSKSVSGDLRDDLRSSTDAIDHPERYTGTGWKEGAQNAAAAIDPKSVEAIRDATPTAVQRALGEASTAMGLPSPAPATAPKAGPTEESPRYRLYVSQAMGDGALKQAIAIAQSHRDLTIILKGVLPGQTVMSIADLLRRVHGDFTTDDPAPSVIIDPTLFAASHVASAPTLERLDRDGSVLVRVRGVMEPSFIDRLVGEQRMGDQGAFGKTVAIAEVDMLEQMKAEAAKVDYEALARAGEKTFWDKYKFADLVPAKERRVRHIDPTVEVQEDVLTADGKLVARKGDRFNPLDMVPFTQTLVVFDATVPAQLAFAKSYVDAHPKKRVTLIASRIDRKGGWDGYSDMERKLDHAVFILQDDVRTTFQIERLPTTVEAVKSKFEIAEIPVSQESEHAAAQPKVR